MSTPLQILHQASVDFFQKNNIVWEIDENGGGTLSLKTGENQCEHILVCMTGMENNRPGTISTGLASTQPQEKTTCISLCAILLFAPYDLLVTSQGTPVILENLEETKTIFLEKNFLTKKTTNACKIFNSISKALQKGEALLHKKLKESPKN